MHISVVVPTCNRNDLLDKCLYLLSSNIQTLSYNNYEVIVTDDSKQNLAKALIEEKYPSVKWVDGPKLGPASNRNNGVRHAQGEWIVFIDDDCLPDKDILSNYKNAIEQNTGSLAFEGSIIPDDWELMKNEMAECPINMDGNCFWSANICVKKELFEKIGGFDEAFLTAAHEDQDIYERLKQYTTIPFLRQCVLTHPVRFGSVRKRLSAIKIQFANWIYYTKKHSNKSIKGHLTKSIFNYAKFSIKDLLRLRFRMVFLDVVKSFYCVYLLVFTPDK